MTHGAGAGAAASTIRVVVNTAELVEAARMGPSCADVRFEAQVNTSHTFGAAVELTHWLDPRPGCGASNTVFWVRLPAGALGGGGNRSTATTLHMSYGNPAVGEAAAAAAVAAAGGGASGYPGNPPAGLFAVYEGFEGNTSAFAATGACGAEAVAAAFASALPAANGGFAAAGVGALAATVRPGRHVLPHHQTHCGPSCLESEMTFSDVASIQ